MIGLLATLAGAVSAMMSLGAEPAAMTVDDAIKALASPSYEERAAATTALCRHGIDARPQLEKAASSDDAELAFRSRHLLNLLDSLFFTGCEITLRFDREAIDWQDEVALIIAVANKSDYGARIPFVAGFADERFDDARQVGRMLDAGDLLTVRHADGRFIDLRTEDILLDPKVTAAVQRRLGEAPTSVVPPGKTLEVKVPMFNRGWARYPLLDEGTYSVALHYVPSWNDPELDRERIGTVSSNVAHIEVLNGAPAEISRGGIQASLAIAQRDGAIRVSLLNRYDRPITVNRNFGLAAPFAQGRWICSAGETTVEIPASEKPLAALRDFEAERLTPVQPGATIDLTRISLERLSECLPADGDRIWQVRFSYLNLGDRKWQLDREQELRADPLAPEVLKRPLPVNISQARLVSEDLEVRLENARSAPQPAPVD